jgi:DNA replication factor GINS
VADTILEALKRALDSELESTALTHLPNDFYSRIAVYTQKIRRSEGSGVSEATVRLVARQVRMIDSMIRQLLSVRARKAIDGSSLMRLTPEERYICLARQRFDKRFDEFARAVSEGQPSFVEFAHKSESERSVMVKVAKHVDEVVGLDLRRYGPFEPEDLVSLPAANADVLIAAGDAVEVHTRGEA